MTEPIQNPGTRTIESLLTRLSVGEKTILDVDNEKGARTLTFSLQKINAPDPEPPPRAESSARNHTFYEAATFAEYLARYGKPGDLVVYANPEQEEMHATLEERATTGRETVSLKPQLHPLWAPWAGLVEKRLPLAAFRDFLNRHRRAVRMPDGRALALMLAQIRAAVEVTIHDGRGRNALNGIVVRSNVQGTDTREVVDLPEELCLHVPLYVGAAPQDVLLDLVLDADASGSVTVLVAASGVQEARVFAFDGMLSVIRDRLKEIDATVCYGEPAETPWTYLK